MSYIEVDIDLDEFDTDDLVDEIISRIQKEPLQKTRKFKAEHKKELVEALSNSPLSLSCSNGKSLEDIFKDELFEKIRDKYTSSQIESALPL